MHALEGLDPLIRTIYRLGKSPRISIASPSLEILEHARDGVKAALRVDNYLEKFSEDVGSKTMKVLEEEIGEAANGLEDALDSLVSDHLSQTESIQQHPLLLSVDLEGVKQHIDSFTQRMKYLKKLFVFRDQEDEDENESFMAGLSSDQCSPGNRTWIINWLASKAASMFLGMKDEYIQELDSLWPKYIDPTSSLVHRWWVNKAASAFMMDKEYDKESHNTSPRNRKTEAGRFIMR